MPPWAGFCARWRCRPAGDTFLFVGAFVGTFRENRPSTEGGWIPDIGIERVLYVASGSMAVQSSTSGSMCWGWGWRARAINNNQGPPENCEFARLRPVPGKTAQEYLCAAISRPPASSARHQHSAAMPGLSGCRPDCKTSASVCTSLRTASLRTSSMLAYAGPKLKFSEAAGSRAMGREPCKVFVEPASHHGYVHHEHAFKPSRARTRWAVAAQTAGTPAVSVAACGRHCRLVV